MPTASTPVRLDADLTRSASEAARHMSRSVSEQISHWARIGRELERAADVCVAEVRKVLDGASAYDALSPKEQALVRTAWLERMTVLRKSLRLDRELAAAGQPYAEADERGLVVLHGAASDATAAVPPRRSRTARSRRPRARPARG